MSDSPRFCRICGKHGDHHTDKHVFVIVEYGKKFTGRVTREFEEEKKVSVTWSNGLETIESY